MIRPMWMRGGHWGAGFDPPTPTSYERLQLIGYDRSMARYSEEMSWNEFCERLYEVLWYNRLSFDSPYELCWVFIQYYGGKVKKGRLPRLCPIAFACKRGYTCFEQLLHSKELDHVVTIEEHKCTDPTKMPHFKIFRYRAALNPDHFQHIRRTVKPRRKDIICLDYNNNGGSLFGFEPQQQRKKATIGGQLFSYECDISEELNRDDGNDTYHDDGRQQYFDDKGKWDGDEHFGQGECSSSGGWAHGLDKLMDMCSLQEEAHCSKTAPNYFNFDFVDAAAAGGGNDKAETDMNSLHPGGSGKANVKKKRGGNKKF